MSTHIEENNINTMLGEAVLKLTDSNREVSFSSLISELTMMSIQETDPERKESCLLAISNIRNSPSMKKKEESKNDRNVHDFFTGESIKDNNKKH